MYVQSEYEYYKHISFKNIKYYGLNKGSIRIYNRVTEILDQPVLTITTKCMHA